MPGLPPTRRGTAVMAALGLLLLAGALLASAATVSSASARAAASERTALVTEGAARRALALTLAEWSSAQDSLVAGEWTELPGGEGAIGAVEGLVSSVRLRPLGGGLFALVAEARLGAGAGELARRRLRLLVQRPPATDTGQGNPPDLPPPRPISRWSLADLY